MILRRALLALLCERPANGYQLRLELLARLHGAGPVNIGQVYTALGRLVDVGHAVVTERPGTRPSGVYVATPAGRASSKAWLASPVDPPAPARGGLAMKLALAATSSHIDLMAMISRERAALEALHQALPAIASPSSDHTRSFDVLASFRQMQVETELAWLDKVAEEAARRDVVNDTTGRMPGGRGWAIAPSDHARITESMTR